jgi:serine/threonine protein kinase
MPSTLLNERGKHYFYINNGKKISITFDEIPFDTKHLTLQWVIRNHRYCIMKRLKNVPSDTLYREVIVQILVYHCLEYFNLKNIVPRVYDIITYKGDIVFTMESYNNAINFSDYLNKNFDNFVEILAQIALYMIPLQNVLFFNHRDLKSDNVLVIEAPVEHTLTFKGKCYKLKAKAKALLVDFGFSCVGYEMAGESTINAGDVLPRIDPCPKEGRDIFQILTSLYSFQIFRESLSPGLKTLFTKWLSIGRNIYTSSAVLNANDPEWIYSITSGTFFSAPTCSPSTILEDIAEHFPDIVTISLE